jgi:DNA-binding protein H-NS
MATSLADINAEIKKNEEQLAQLKKQAEDFRNQERAGVIDDIRKKIVEYGLTASDLKLSSRASKGRSTKSSTPAKYQGPNGEAWSGGRGRKPRWVTEALATGKSLSDFEI